MPVPDRGMHNASATYQAEGFPAGVALERQEVQLVAIRAVTVLAQTKQVRRVGPGPGHSTGLVGGAWRAALLGLRVLGSGLCGLDGAQGGLKWSAV
jgi:hypothetical protein